MMTTNINTKLDPQKISSIVHQIIQNTEELLCYYEQSSPSVRVAIFKNLSESYAYECKIAGKILPVDKYQECIENIIGWNWVLPDPPIKKSLNTF